jgi:hypothetical protein
MAPDSNTPDAHRYRLGRLEQDVHDLQVKLDDYKALQNSVTDLRRDVEATSSEMSSLRRALYTAAISVSVSAVLFAATFFASQ